MVERTRPRRRRACGCRWTPGARAFTSLLRATAVYAVGLAPSGTAAQEPIRLDLRLGAMYSSVLAETAVTLIEDVGTGTQRNVEIQPTVGITGDAGVLLELSPQVDGELRVGAVRQGLSGTGPSGSWSAGDVTTYTFVAGLGVHVRPEVVIRGGLGKLVYSSDAQVFRDGASTGLLLVGGVGYQLPVFLPFRLRLDADGQWHPFGSTALRRSGAADGSVYELSVKVAGAFGGVR